MLAGPLVGKFNSIHEEDVEPALGTVDEARGVPTRNGRGSVPEHLVDLYGEACDGCEIKRECLVAAQLRSEYKDLFSCGDHDMGLTMAICHEIPLVAGKGPNWQPTHWLGLEKEEEVSCQVQHLLNEDLIEPAHSA